MTAAQPTAAPLASWSPMSAPSLGTLSRRSMTFTVELEQSEDYAFAWVEVLTVSAGDTPCCELLDLDVQVGGDKASAAAWIREHVEELAHLVEVR